MIKGTHLLRSALLALLVLAVISGGSLATGDLFDEDYEDCPHQSRRLTEGFISDLTASGNASEEDEVDVSWAAIDPTTWGLGPNAFNTSFVVILNDGSNHTQTLSLGTRSTKFEGIETGREVRVQMAIVVDHPGGNYLISDIEEVDINQNLTAPAFASGWMRVMAVGDSNATTVGFQRHGTAAYASTPVAGMMYYIGYNENFANYKSNASNLTTSPSTERLRIGLAHSASESDDERSDVDFEAYRIRIEDSSGDVLPEGDQVATVASNYGNETLTYNPSADSFTADATGNRAISIPNHLFLYDLSQILPFNTTTGTGANLRFTGTDVAARTVGTATPGYALSSVRIADDGDITVALHHNSVVTASRVDGQLGPHTEPFSMVKVDSYGSSAFTTDIASSDGEDELPIIGSVYAEAPDEHRDFPIDTLTTDETYKIEAWAINDDGETISPVATLTVRPKDTAQGSVANFQDYLNTTAATVTAVTTTSFTVIE